ncbi:MAG TPA: FG-GAP-like repeat-containing protein [Thiolinea sp.]|nr:FG-GAP-like repeat-containing protein [Thiolinea sp.]
MNWQGEGGGQNIEGQQTGASDITSQSNSANNATESTNLSAGQQAGSATATGEATSETENGDGLSNSRREARTDPLIDNYVGSTFDGSSDVVGHLAADFAVSASGAATYSIPIAIPPGIAEVQPSISLNYDSQAGDGIAGRGFSISGLSQVNRCGSTLAQDGKIRAVELSSADHYCLGGQRLIEIADNGATRTYKTEIDSYNEISANFNTTTNQPTSFTIKTVAGETLFYGANAQSRLVPVSPGTLALGQPLSWLISKMSDIKGNYITYNYQSIITANGAEKLIKQIQYTGTSAAAPFAAVNFDYEDKIGVKSTSYIAGRMVYNSKRLKSISVTQGAAGSVSDTTVREYRLAYYDPVSGSANQFDKIKAIQECGNYNETGAADLKCSPPTWFRWNGGYQSESAQLFGVSTTRSAAERLYTPTDADLQGDNPGISGFYGQGYVLNEYGRGTDQSPNWSYGHYKVNGDRLYPAKDYTLMGDVNGDGLADIIGLKGNVTGAASGDLFRYDYQVVASISNGKDFDSNVFHASTSALLTSVWIKMSENGVGNLATLADVNADGLSDLVLISYYDVYVALSNGSRFTAPVKWRSQYLSSDTNFFTGTGGKEKGANQRYVMDINGDGRADLVALAESGLYAALSTSGQSRVFGSVGRISSDFNIDDSASYEISVNNDDSITWDMDVISNIARFSLADVNGDGLPDAIRLSDSGIEVAINTGNFTDTWGIFGLSSYFSLTTRWDDLESIWSSSADTNRNIAYWLNRLTPYSFSDINGDGLADFVLFGFDGVRVAFSTGKSFQAPIKLLNSFGLQTNKYNVSTQGTTLTDCSDLPNKSYYDSSTTQSRKMWRDEGKTPRYLVDVNGDGRADILGFGSNGIYVALSEGNTFGAMTKWIAPTDTSFSYDACWQSGHNIRTVADVTGDGLVDLVGVGFTGVYVGQNFVKPQRIEQIVSGGPIPEAAPDAYDGLHRSIDIDYDVATTSSSYQRAGTPYLKVPVYVVSAHHDSDGDIGTTRPHRATLEYRYHDLIVDPYRGSQGFRFREVIDKNAKTRTAEYYHQYFPMTGRPYVQRTYAKNKNDKEIMVKEVATNVDPAGNTPDSYGVYNVRLQSTLETDFTLLAGKRYKQLSTEFKDYDSCDQARELKTLQANWDGGTPQPYEAVYDVTTINEYPTTGSCRDRSRLISSTVTHLVTGQPAATKKSSFQYYSSGQLWKETVEPDKTDEQKLLTTYTYNAVGQVVTKTVSGLGGTISTTGTRDPSISRKITTTYTPDYRFVASTTDAAGFTISFEYDKRFGLVKKTTDPNGLISQSRYNGFAQVYLQEGPQGGVVQTKYEWCRASIQGAYATYCVTTQNLNVATTQYTKTWFDSVDRVLRVETLGLKDADAGQNAIQIYQDKQYDHDTGRLMRESRPYFKADTAYWTNYTYDSLGRVLTATTPDQSVTSTTYDGLKVTVTNALGQSRTEIGTPRGNIVKAIDYVGGIVSHTYDSLGNLVQTIVTATDADGRNHDSVTTMAYNLRGHKVRMTDPDMGTWGYHYNAMGELTLQYNVETVNGQETKTNPVSILHDTAGRMTWRKASDETTQWTYYPVSAAEKDRGHLQQVSTNSTDASGQTYAYVKNFTYDDYGRAISVRETLPEPDGSSHTYEFVRSFDSFGRLRVLTYPQFNTQLAKVGLNYEYNFALGYLQTIRTLDYTKVLWNLDRASAEGQAIKQSLGNGVTDIRDYEPLRNTLRNQFSYNAQSTLIRSEGYTFDALGNLLERRDNLNAGVYEGFVYDNMNRLDTVTSAYHAPGGGLTSTVQSHTYDGHGNLLTKGELEYTYEGGSWPGSVHQVAQQDQNGVVDDVFSYDGRGNMLYAGDARHIAWTSFNKPSRITRLDQSARFAYNSDQQRMLKMASRGTTWYLDAGYERFRDSSSGRETFKYPVMVGGQQVAYVKQNWLPGGTDPLDNAQSTLYLLSDHLGSVSQLLDSAGNRLESLSFDAWGSRRAGSWSPLDTKTSTLSLLRHYALTIGFTGHEMDEDFGFINMKGRLYDPRLGRFISADPFVQFANNTQSYNHYSYVLNNPLSYTDPTGYFLSGLRHTLGKVFNWVGDNFRTIVAIAVGAATGFVANAIIGGFWGAVVGGAVAGFSSTLVATGSLEAAFAAGAIGALSGGAAWEIAHGLGPLGRLVGAAVNRFGGVALSIAHGVAQGAITSLLQGGKFKDGFIGGFLGHATKGWGAAIGLGEPGTGGIQHVVGRTVLASAVGGTISQWTGGKFANGARSAAFTHLFNAEGGSIKAGTKPLPDSSLDSLPQGLVDGVAGFGDTASFGLSSYIRDLYGIDGGIDFSSEAYATGVYAGIAGSIGTGAAVGTAFNIGLRGVGGAKNLYHFTSIESANGIISSGVIRSGGGAYGRGVYATAVQSPAYATISGAASTQCVFTISGAKALATPFPGTFRIPNNVLLK